MQAPDDVKRMFPQLADHSTCCGETRGYIKRNMAKHTGSSGDSHTKIWWLPIELTNGNNGRGFHWGAKAKERKSLEAFFIQYFGGKQRPFGFPVEITVTRVLGKGQRFWDCGSELRGNWKELQDAMVAVGLFVDDSPKWITKVTGRQDDTTRDAGPAIEITVVRSGT